MIKEGSMAHNIAKKAIKMIASYMRASFLFIIS